MSDLLRDCAGACLADTLKQAGLPLWDSSALALWKVPTTRRGCRVHPYLAPSFMRSAVLAISDRVPGAEFEEVGFAHGTSLFVQVDGVRQLAALWSEDGNPISPLMLQLQ
ncbi:MAG: hypothetical protein JWL87_744 [Candidatus Adlerbacteria bacterium]|nr:hypothetical protein [Candidatus Adlerbacteria bacterium]